MGWPRHVWPLLAAALLVVACVPVYLPPVANAPLLGHRGELDVAVQSSFFGYDAQAAFSPVEHLGVTGTASFGTGDAAHLEGEAAAGFVTVFGERGRLNLFAGGGGGRSAGRAEITANGITVERRARGTFGRGFVQVDVGMVHRVVDVGVSLKAAYVRFDYAEHPATPPLSRADNLFLEPTAFVRLGSEWLKGELQVGYIQPTRGGTPEFFPVNASIGLHAELNVLGGEPPWGEARRPPPSPLPVVPPSVPATKPEPGEPSPATDGALDVR